MLIAIKERATGWIAWFIVGVLIIPFAFWGINTYFEGVQNIDIAEVNGNDVDYNKYQRRLQQSRQNAELDPEVLASVEFKRNVVNLIIEEDLLVEYAKDNGYQLSDVQLAANIRSTPEFQGENGFDHNLYLSTLSASGYSVAQYEQLRRRNHIIQQLRTTVAGGSFALADEVQGLVTLQLQKRKARYALVDQTHFLKKIEVSDDEISIEYTQNAEDYIKPARIKVEYVEMSIDDIAAGLDIATDDIEFHYQNNPQQFATPAERYASHILITADDEAAAETGGNANDIALAKAEELIQKLKAGANFAKLAKQHSGDPGSAQNGGDLGRVDAGIMVKPFEEAVFAMKRAGQLSEQPVKTGFGYHIIKLTKYTPRKQKSFKEARTEIKEALLLAQAQNLFSERVETMHNIAYEQPTTLQPLASELGLEIKTSEWFGQEQGEGLGGYAKIREAAFSAEVIEENINSAAIEVELNQLVVLRKLEYQPLQSLALDEVRDDIKSSIAKSKAAQQAIKYGTEALATIQAANTDSKAKGRSAWKKALRLVRAKSLSLPAQRGHDQGDADQTEQSEILQAVFSAPRPAKDSLRYGGLSLTNGNYALFVLESVNDQVNFKSEQATELATSIRESLQVRHGEEYFISLLRGIKTRAAIEIYDQNL